MGLSVSKRSLELLSNATNHNIVEAIDHGIRAIEFCDEQNASLSGSW